SRSHPALHSCFFFNDPATTDIYTLSLHDALPISGAAGCASTTWYVSTSSTRKPGRSGSTSRSCSRRPAPYLPATERTESPVNTRSEEHTSELQSRGHLVCRLLLEKKNNDNPVNNY